MKQTDPVYGQTNANVVWDGQVMIVNNVNNIRIVNTVIVMYQWNVFVKKDGVAYFAIKVKIQKKNDEMQSFIFLFLSNNLPLFVCLFFLC